MNVIKRELKSNSKSMFFWSISIIFLVFIWMIEFESFANNPLMNDFMDTLPEGLLSIFGFSGVNLGTLKGFISAISLYIYLILGIQAALLGAFIISKEERGKTVEYLFSKPVSRKNIIKSKLISGVINIIVLNLITFLSLVISSNLYDKIGNFIKSLILLMLAIFIIQMIFFSIGVFIASVTKEAEKSSSRSAAVLTVLFIISSLLNVTDKIDFIKYLTPFQYFDANYILNMGNIEIIYIILSLVIIFVGIGSAFIFYPKKDLSI